MIGRKPPLFWKYCVMGISQAIITVSDHKLESKTLTFICIGIFLTRRSMVQISHSKDLWNDIVVRFPRTDSDTDDSIHLYYHLIMSLKL